MSFLFQTDSTPLPVLRGITQEPILAFRLHYTAWAELVRWMEDMVYDEQEKKGLETKISKRMHSNGKGGRSRVQ